MSNNLQQVFSKFGFKTKKDRSGDNKSKKVSNRRLQQQQNNNNNNEDSDSDDYQHQQQNSTNHHQNRNLSHPQQHIQKQQQSQAQQQHTQKQHSSLNSAQKAYLQQQREYYQQQQLRALQKKQKLSSNSHSQSHRSHRHHQSDTKKMSEYHPSNNTNNTSSHKPSSSHHSSSTQHRSSKSRSKQHQPNGAYNHLDPKAFHANMTELEIQKIMGLRGTPSYKTDEKGYIEFQPGLLVRKNFVILDTLGRGTFSKVFEAVDIMDQSKLAIKVIRNTHRYIEAAKTELRVLQHITNADDGTSSCIHLKDHFSWNNHPCFVFRLFGPSIYTVMSKNRFRPFPDCIVRSLTYQICNAIQFLHHLGIIFTDLKPENMVFVDGRTHPVKIHGKTHLLPFNSRIKIVDFGSAVYEPRYDPNNPKTWKFKDGYNYLIQTRHYRAPEVVLEMPWKRPVDVWSVGCVVLEFLFGSMVFNTHCPIDHLNQMQKMVGALPRELIRLSSDAKFKQLFHTSDGRLRLEDARRSRVQAKRLDSYFNLHRLEHRHLYDFVCRCLKWRAYERITGDQLLKHEYFIFCKNILTHDHKFTLANSSKSNISDLSNSKKNDHNKHNHHIHGHVNHQQNK